MLKRDPRPKLHPSFYAMFLLILWRKNLSRSYEIAKFWIQRKWRHTCECKKYFTPVFLHIFVSFVKKKTSVKSNGLFVHLSWAYEVAKFWVFKLHLDVSDIIHANEQTKPANCGLYVNFWRMLFCYFVLWRKKFILSKSCYFGLRSPKFLRRFV